MTILFLRKATALSATLISHYKISFHVGFSSAALSLFSLLRFGSGEQTPQAIFLPSRKVNSFSGSGFLGLVFIFFSRRSFWFRSFRRAFLVLWCRSVDGRDLIHCWIGSLVGLVESLWSMTWRNLLLIFFCPIFWV